MYAVCNFCLGRTRISSLRCLGAGVVRVKVRPERVTAVLFGLFLYHLYYINE